MLTTLRIKNLALVSDLTLELKPGYNVITGETGAGKSILIGALNLVLGERADRSLIRSGEDACSVEASFDIRELKSPISALLDESGLEPCEDGQLLLKRTLTASGTNRQFVNGSPTSLACLSTIGQWLVDIHGPHEHQSLLYPGRQITILDAFGKLDGAREEFSQLLKSLEKLEIEKASLIGDEQTYIRELDLLRFQINEISAARLEPGEGQSLEEEYHRASNAAKLIELTQGILSILSEKDEAILTAAGVMGRSLHELQRIDPSAKAIVELHEQVVSQLSDLQREVSAYADKVDLDPNRLGQLEERLNVIHGLKRKYGSTLQEVLAFEASARKRLQSLEQRDSELQRLTAETQKLDAQIWRAGQALSKSRRKVIPALSKTVSKELGDLGFQQSRFEVSLESLEPSKPGQPAKGPGLTGLDTIEFQFAPNPGEPMRPLRSIASSGELARVMLALKTVLAAEDEVPVLVFDEVDANVGGETAHAVGLKMQRIAHNRQVLCITHLPQVAAPAGAHFTVSKQVRSGRTISEVHLLDPTERITELARMLGGQSAAARKHAEALVQSSP